MAGRPAVVEAERAQINERRKKLRRQELPTNPDGEGAVAGLAGLALSGGGIRSASFCLGVLQALNQRDVLKRVDYLSTVSGGGYIGSSVTATTTATRGEFVFGNRAGTTAPSDIYDTRAVQHLRNYSNYLIPFGARDGVTAVAIIVRGLVANVALTVPFILMAAAVTVFLKPSRDTLATPSLPAGLVGWLPAQNFGLTLLCAGVAFLLAVGWALWRSFLPSGRRAEFRGWPPTFASVGLVFLAFTFFCELQPYVLRSMFDAVDAPAAASTGAVSALWSQWLTKMTVLAAPVAAAVTFFREQLGGVLKQRGSSGFRALLAVGTTKLVIWVAGAALPLLIWMTYLNLSYWGIDDYRACTSSAHCTNATPPVCCDDTAAGQRCHRLGPPETTACATVDPPDASGDGKQWHTPKWVSGSVALLERWNLVPERWSATASFYLLAGVAIFLLSYWLEPNANSLHQLYRDRLSRAFLFDPTQGSGRRWKTIDKGRDLRAISPKLSEIDASAGPYHLVNAALNVQGSDFANRRGRNADFFIFSKCYVGSDATGYAETPAFEEKAEDLDLATAMAISGAAASSYMGAASIRPLAPTLALLNIRLGYWLANPKYVVSKDERSWWRRNLPDLYLWSEISGRLYEDDDEVYLTDGGHIENLGIYELLCRRCELIIAVDGEADPDMHLPSFIELQRYARIDRGVRIDLGWEDIQHTTVACMDRNANPDASSAPLPPKSGPHVAVGRIDYGGGRKGWLVYIKSSLTGDENDYVRDYARRAPRFPHETTGDQFFSEEQFEVYRALGFHAAFGFLDGKNTLVAASASTLDGSDALGAAPVAASDPRLKPVRELLGL